MWNNVKSFVKSSRAVSICVNTSTKTSTCVVELPPEYATIRMCVSHGSQPQPASHTPVGEPLLL